MENTSEAVENQGDAPQHRLSTPMPDVGGIAGYRLNSLILRIERLEEERRTLGADIKEVYAEAKGSGLDAKIIRLLIRERRMSKDDLDEQETLLGLYRRALAGWDSTPLGSVSIGFAEAREAGRQDGLSDSRDNATKWPAGTIGHGDYELGFEDGRNERVDHDDGPAPPPHRRGRTRKAHAEAAP